MNLLLKGILGVCKFIGYKTCAKVAGLSVGKKAVTYGANYLLGNILPFRIIKCVVAVAPYTPAAVVLATGGTAALAANATYVVISQVSEYMFVCAVKKASWEGAKITLRVAKYVFITKPLGLDAPSSSAGAGAGIMLAGLMSTKDGADEGWVLVEEDPVGGEPHSAHGDVNQLLNNLKTKNPAAETEGVTAEMLENSLKHVTKVAAELSDDEENDGLELVDTNGVVYEEAWDKSVVTDTLLGHPSSSPTSPREEDEFVMV